MSPALSQAFTERRTLLFSEVDLTEKFAGAVKPLREVDVRSLCCVPLRTHERTLGVLSIGGEPETFDPAAVGLIEELAARCPQHRG